MLIAVSSEGKGSDSPMCPRFGRAPGFVIRDTQTGASRHLDNSAAEAGGAAGIRAAKVVADAGAEVVITGRVGPKAEEALRRAGVAVFLNDAATVAQAVEAYVASLDGAGASGSGPGVPGAGGQGRGRAAGPGGGGRGGGRGPGGGRCGR